MTNPITLTEGERELSFLETLLAKVAARRVELQDEAQRLLERAAEPQGIRTEGTETPLVIALTIDLLKVEPKLFAFAAEQFAKIVDEVRASLDQEHDLRRQIAALRPTVPMTVKVSFPGR